MVNNNTQRIDVYDSYKFSDGRIIEFLKFTGGKIPWSTLLEDESGRQWRVQQYYWTTNSPEGYEKILTEEEQNIFQYLLVGLNHQDKPVKDLIVILVPKGIVSLIYELIHLTA